MLRTSGITTHVDVRLLAFTTAGALSMLVLAVTVMMTTMTAVRVGRVEVVVMKTMNGLAVVAHRVAVLTMTLWIYCVTFYLRLSRSSPVVNRTKDCTRRCSSFFFLLP
jgi:hypothetical protein